MQGKETQNLKRARGKMTEGERENSCYMSELAKYVCQFVGNALLLTQNEYETREKRQRKEDMARFNPP